MLKEYSAKTLITEIGSIKSRLNMFFVWPDISSYQAICVCVCVFWFFYCITFHKLHHETVFHH